MSLGVAIRRYGRELIAVVVFMALALAVAAYILEHQRLRFPWEDVMEIEAEFESAQAVTPGQGQTVTVAGVQIGEIGRVRLEEGRAVITLDIDPSRAGPIYRNARMLLRPKTGLQDMSVSVEPGTPDPALPDGGRLRDGDRLPASNTRPHVNSDEVLAALDADTRRYLTIVANAGGQGLRGRGDELRDVLRAAQPTLEQTARVTEAIAARRRELRRLVSNLHALSRATASKDRELATLVSAASAVLQTIGQRESELRGSLERLPGTLETTREALAATRTLAGELGPALTDLRPAARLLVPALVRLRPLLREATPIVRDDVRPLVREATPLLRDLRPALLGLERSVPPLIRTVRVLTYVVNELGYNPPGPEEGYLFWLSWFAHNANSVLTVEDAHGVAWRGLALVGCSTAAEVIAADPILEPIGNLPNCGQTAGSDQSKGPPGSRPRAPGGAEGAEPGRPGERPGRGRRPSEPGGDGRPESGGPAGPTPGGEPGRGGVPEGAPAPGPGELELLWGGGG